MSDTEGAAAAPRSPSSPKTTVLQYLQSDYKGDRKQQFIEYVMSKEATDSDFKDLMLFIGDDKSFGSALYGMLYGAKRESQGNRGSESRHYSGNHSGSHRHQDSHRGSGSHRDSASHRDSDSYRGSSSHRGSGSYRGSHRSSGSRHHGGSGGSRHHGGSRYHGSSGGSRYNSSRGGSHGDVNVLSTMTRAGMPLVKNAINNSTMDPATKALVGGGLDVLGSLL